MMVTQASTSMLHSSRSYFDTAVGPPLQSRLSSLSDQSNVGFQEWRRPDAACSMSQHYFQRESGPSPPSMPPIPVFARTPTTEDQDPCEAPVRRMARHQKNRHCKYKRDRYRRMVQRLVKLSIEDPQTFAYEMENNLPPSIAECQVSRAKLEATIESLRPEMEADMRMERGPESGCSRQCEEQDYFERHATLRQGHVGQWSEHRCEGAAALMGAASSGSSDDVQIFSF
mmetsp:Transcript_73868/g.153912  ORF Transcript_73868/g.153912 Transcript_73868/m.153912 type:complete len:228 (+) Transcript_73868:136-819(+)